MSICLFLGLIKICFWLVSHFLPLSLFVFPHSLPLLPAGEADSGQGACFLWPGCRSRTHLSPGRVKEHRLRNSLSPALFLWHGFLTLVSTHTLFYHINPSSLCPIVILNGLLGEQLEHDSLHPVFFTVLLSCLITSVLHGLISTYKGSLCKKKKKKKKVTFLVRAAVQLQWKHIAATALFPPFQFDLVFLFVFTFPLWT